MSSAWPISVDNHQSIKKKAAARGTEIDIPPKSSQNFNVYTERFNLHSAGRQQRPRGTPANHTIHFRPWKRHDSRTGRDTRRADLGAAILPPEGGVCSINAMPDFLNGPPNQLVLSQPQRHYSQPRRLAPLCRNLSRYGSRDEVLNAASSSRDGARHPH
jgi:hypothetical protein